MALPLPKLLTAFVAAVTLAYPLVVYLGLGHLEPKLMAVLLIALALARAIAARQAFWWAAAGGAAVLAGMSVWGNALLPLKLYPVLVSAVFLFIFSVSLLRPPTVIERLARLTDPNLPLEAVAYTRGVTRVWCGFFVVNGSIAAATALWASNAVWALYTGLVSYVLTGLLFACEWLVRQRVRARIAAAEVAHG